MSSTHNDSNKSVALVDWMRKMILHGKFPGLLSEDLIIKTYKAACDQEVSRNPVRQAIAVLETEGLVAVFAKKGVLVNTPKAEDVTDAKDIFLDILTKSFSPRSLNTQKINVKKLLAITEEMQKHSGYLKNVRDMEIVHNQDEIKEHQNLMLDLAQDFFTEIAMGDVKARILNQVCTFIRLAGVYPKDYIALTDHFQKVAEGFQSVADETKKSGLASNLQGRRSFEEVLGQWVGAETALSYFKASPFIARA